MVEFTIENFDVDAEIGNGSWLNCDIIDVSAFTNIGMEDNYIENSQNEEIKHSVDDILSLEDQYGRCNGKDVVQISFFYSSV